MYMKYHSVLAFVQAFAGLGFCTEQNQRACERIEG